MALCSWLCHMDQHCQHFGKSKLLVFWTAQRCLSGRTKPFWNLQNNQLRFLRQLLWCRCKQCCLANSTVCALPHFHGPVFKVTHSTLLDAMYNIVRQNHLRTPRCHSNYHIELKYRACILVLSEALLKASLKLAQAMGIVHLSPVFHCFKALATLKCYMEKAFYTALYLMAIAHPGIVDHTLYIGQISIFS